MKTTLWLHSHFNLIEVLRQEDREMRIVGSYHSRKYPEALLADHFEIEPKFEDEAQFIDWALNFVTAHGIEVFLVGRKMAAIAAAEQRFKSLGCKLITACDAGTHRLISNKVCTYDTLARANVPLPAYQSAANLFQFSSAVENFAGLQDVVCFKPSVGIFGYGFRVIETPENMHLLAGIPRELIVTAAEALDYLGSQEQFAQQIVMEYLPGQETSVDCLAHNGKLLRAVTRRKNADGSRVLSESPHFVELAGELTRHFGLTNLFNVQFRERADGSPVLLEINSRMAGGTNMSCLSGVVLPYWAIKLALSECTESDIPYPRTGLRVAELRRAVVLP
jgi:biotin carboxylase